jgi:hypothetical protein
MNAVERILVACAIGWVVLAAWWALAVVGGP